MIGVVQTVPIEPATQAESERLASRTCAGLRARVAELEASSLELVDAIEHIDLSRMPKARSANYRLRSALGLPAKP